MNNLVKTLATLALATVTLPGAMAQGGSRRQMNHDWNWDDSRSWQSELRLNKNQGQQIAQVNRAAQMQIKRLSPNLSQAQRQKEMRAIRERARYRIRTILNSRQRQTMNGHGWGWKDDVPTLKSTPPDRQWHGDDHGGKSGKGKGRGKGGG